MLLKLFSIKLIAGTMLVVMLFSSTATVSYAATSQYQPRTNAEMLAYLYGVLAQLQAQLAAMKADGSSGSSRTTRQDPNPYFISAITIAPTKISRSEVTLWGTADKGSSETLDAWFEYGVGSKLTKVKYLPTITRSSAGSVSVDLSDLLSGTTYSYRLVVEDEDGNMQYGQTRTFKTVSTANSQSFSGRPTAETEGSSNLSSYGGYIYGFVSMNDYSEGNVFFVYGTDRSLVRSADEYNSYAEIPVLSGAVTKNSVDANFTGRNTAYTYMYGLSNARTYYYRVCVEYADSGDSPELECGQIETFTTLN